jgi:phosphate transport system substrate-binding protein
MKTLAMTIIAGVLFLNLVTAVNAEEIRIGGGGAAIITVFEPLKEQFEKNNGVTLTLNKSSRVKALVALDKGEIDAATFAHSMELVLEATTKEGINIDPAAFPQQVIAKNRIVAFTHKSNRISKLSKAQLKKIFTGKVSNWKEVGGNDMPITVVWGTSTPGQNETFIKEILDGEPVTSKSLKAIDYQGIRDRIMATPGAIGIDPVGMSMATIRTIDIPLVITPVILITKGKPSAKIEKLVKFYNEEFSYLNE